MSQFLSMIPSMRMEQRLTPQLIQSMEILQLPLMALEARIREELQSNPVLEDARSADPEGSSSDRAEAASEKTAQSEEADSFDRLDKLSREYDFDTGDQGYARASAGTGERDAKMDAMANTAARGPSLQEFLQEQWGLIDHQPEIRRAGEAVIRWMDADGYLRRQSEHPAPDADGNTPHLPLIVYRDTESFDLLDQEISASINPPVGSGVLEEAVARLQALEPRGVCARDLAECLLIQLDALVIRDELAEKIVEDHLEDVARNRIPVVVKETGATSEQIKDALAVISRLHHHPGLLLAPNDVPTIMPDIMVDYAEDGDGYTVRLTRGNSPRLRLSAHYRHMLENKEGDAESLAFLRKNLEAAKALIDAIQFRSERLLEIGKIVIDRQRGFFDEGPHKMNILLMRDIAQELGCDPSTISRTVDGKYIQSPRGIHPLRMFFTGGTETADGQAISWDAVKLKVKELIDKEDKANPMSDDAIAKLLAETEGEVSISRRTVAKYRAQLNIPSARQRKEF